MVLAISTSSDELVSRLFLCTFSVYEIAEMMLVRKVVSVLDNVLIFLIYSKIEI